MRLIDCLYLIEIMMQIVYEEDEQKLVLQQRHQSDCQGPR